MTSPQTRPYALPATLWFAAIALSMVQLALVLTRDDHEASLPLSLLIGALFLAALALTVLRSRRRRG